jgi:ATPase subunit of ABC transporter with duplicated ATPase domains
VDEPTNHIDGEARSLLLEALLRYRGVGVIVSHDRDLLDALCGHCLWLDPPGAVLYPGAYSEARSLREAGQEAARRERADARRGLSRIEREVARRREVAGRADRERSRRGLAPKDSDGRARKDLARLTGKDGQAGRLAQQLSGRAARARERLDGTRVPKDHSGSIWLDGSVTRRTSILDVPAGDLPLGDGRVLRHPALRVGPRERIALTGPNGAGKSTLLDALLPARRIEAEHVLHLPQEVDAAAARLLLDEVRALPGDRLGHVMQVVARLGSAPGRLLETREPSPGEVRKLQFALGVARAPQWIVMDEPTNHLDVPAIEALETALADCPCALLLVSHDARFLEGLTTLRWRLETGADGVSRLVAEQG